MHIHMKSIWTMELVKQLLQKIKWDLWMLLFIQIREFIVKLKNITKLIENGKRKEEKRRRGYQKNKEDIIKEEEKEKKG